ESRSVRANRSSSRLKPLILLEDSCWVAKTVSDFSMSPWVTRKLVVADSPKSLDVSTSRLTGWLAPWLASYSSSITVFKEFDGTDAVKSRAVRSNVSIEGGRDFPVPSMVSPACRFGPSSEGALKLRYCSPIAERSVTEIDELRGISGASPLMRKVAFMPSEVGSIAVTSPTATPRYVTWECTNSPPACTHLTR